MLEQFIPEILWDPSQEGDVNSVFVHVVVGCVAVVIVLVVAIMLVYGGGCSRNSS